MGVLWEVPGGFGEFRGIQGGQGSRGFQGGSRGVWGFPGGFQGLQTPNFQRISENFDKS